MARNGAIKHWRLIDATTLYRPRFGMPNASDKPEPGEYHQDVPDTRGDEQLAIPFNIGNCLKHEELYMCKRVLSAPPKKTLLQELRTLILDKKPTRK